MSRLLAPIYRLYAWRLWRHVQRRPVPSHLAVIMDGNRAQRPRPHRPRPRRPRLNRPGRTRDDPAGDDPADAERVKNVLIWSQRAGIPAVSLFVLSVDNLSGRWPADLSGVIAIAEQNVKYLARLGAKFGWQVRAIGRLELVPSGLRTALVDASAETAGAGGMLVQLAIGYGGREEIVDALRRWAEQPEIARRPSVSEALERLEPADLTPYLYAGDAPPPDLILRTSSEVGLSGFLLWQCVHSNLSFQDVPWPAFQEIDFLHTLRTFQARQRHSAQP